MIKYNVDKFISNHVIKRNISFFEQDFKDKRKDLKREIVGSSVLILGGAGTIGSSFLDCLLEFKPKKVVIIDFNENGLTELTRNIRSSVHTHAPDEFITYPLDYGSKIFYDAIEAIGPFDIVANFSANKHVRSEKDQFSVRALLNNNVFKTKKLLEFLSNEMPPKHFFSVSTDKAANPVNIMGASKRLMEQVMNFYASKIKVSSARFANVAFSNGSLLDGYLNRLSKKQPLTAPLEIERFFVSPSESGQLCLMAAILGENRDIFFPKLEERNMVSFEEILLSFLSFLSLKPHFCLNEDEAKKFNLTNQDSDVYPVYLFESSTSGEKKYEEFYEESEGLDINSYESMGVIKNEETIATDFSQKLKYLKEKLESNSDKQEISNVISQLINSFNHLETGKNLDQQM